MAATLTADQTNDMLADLAAGALDDVFSQDELQRFYDRADGDYNLAVYYGWRQILANSAAWVDYQVAQTRVSKSQAFAHIRDMVALWASESKATANQLLSAGINGVPTRHKPKPADEQRQGYFRRGRWVQYG